MAEAPVPPSEIERRQADRRSGQEDRRAGLDRRLNAILAAAPVSVVGRRPAASPGESLQEAEARAEAGRQRKAQEDLDRLVMTLINCLAEDAEASREVERAAAQGDAHAREAARGHLERHLERVLEETHASITRRVRTEALEIALDEILGLGPIQRLLADPDVSEIMVNGPHEVYVERHGVQTFHPEIRFRDAEHLMRVVARIVAPLGRRVDVSTPVVDARLSDGSRVNVAVPPVALTGPYLTVRKFHAKTLTVDDLIGRGAMTDLMARFLRTAIEARLNVLISGGTGSGKTTLLNALAVYIPDGERIVTIEDSAELQVYRIRRNVCCFENRRANVEGRGEVTTQDLVRNALRMRPDRIIVGEVRGVEALDMLQAMNTGHDGSITTCHANTAEDALARIESMVYQTGTDLPLHAVRDQVSSALQLVIQVARLQGGVRRVVQIAEIGKVNENGRIAVAPIWTFRTVGVAEDGRNVGYYTYHGIPALTKARIERQGVRLPDGLWEVDGEAPGRSERHFMNDRRHLDGGGKRDRRQRNAGAPGGVERRVGTREERRRLGLDGRRPHAASAPGVSAALPA